VRRIIGICGTPGTGKKTVAPIVSKLVGLPPPVSIASFVRRGESSIDTAILRKRLLRAGHRQVVLVGHLLPHVLLAREAAFVAVLRCEPSTLKNRLLDRGYPGDKVAKNVEAELIGVVLDECTRRFGAGKVREYDTTRSSPREVAKAIADDAKEALAGRRKRPRRPKEWIDWTLDYDSSTKLRSLLAGKSDPPAST
jgi:adenylate kinase